MSIPIRIFAVISMPLLFVGSVFAENDVDKSNDEEESPDTIEEVVTIGLPIKDYMATDALTGTKSDALLMDLPLSLSVVSQELINDRSLTYLGEALDSVSGAQRKYGYGGTQNFGAFLRGFDASFLTLRNGLRDSGFYTLRDSANVERFEVLKGPGSVLYGALTPGGITNTITKKPTSEFLGRVNATFGSHSYYRAELDVGGPLGGGFTGRINLAYEDSESYRDEVENDGIFVAPVIRWSNDRTSWTLEGEFKESEFTWDLGLPRAEVVLSLPESRFLGEPDGINDVSSQYFSSLIEHRFNDEWRIRQNTSYAKSEGDYLLRSAFMIADDNQTAIRSGFDTEEESENTNVQLELLGELTAFGVGHQLVFGVEYYETTQFFDFLFQGIAPIDIFNPVYGAQPSFEFPLFGSDGKTESAAIYFQNLVSLNDQFKLLFGVRYDDVKAEVEDILAMVQTIDRSNHATSPQIGLVYQPTEQASFYISYSSSFIPQTTSASTADGSGLEPEEGKQFEIGLKQEMFDGKAILNLAAYKITKENVTMNDPDNFVFVIQVGEQESQGVEFDIAGSLLPGWDVLITGSYIDAEVTNDVRASFEGSRLFGAPEWSGSIWTKYSFSEGPLVGWAVGIGAYYAGEREITIPNPDWNLPSYTRLDAMLSYDIADWSFQLNVNNIADEEIFDLTSTSIMPQEPRSFRFNIGYNF